MSKNKVRKQDTSTHIEQRDKVKDKFQIREFNWTEKQKQFINLVEDKNTKVMFCKGAAGTAKSLLSVYAALKALNDSKIGEIIYVRQPVESSHHGLGYLAGSLEEKLAPYLAPLEDKLSELLYRQTIDTLLKEERIKGIPLGFLRGLSFRASYIIIDEAQNFTSQDILVALTRLGQFSKMILIGDIKQADIKNSGFSKVYDAFNDIESKGIGIQTFEFDKNDIMRNPILTYIVNKFEAL